MVDFPFFSFRGRHISQPNAYHASHRLPANAPHPRPPEFARARDCKGIFMELGVLQMHPLQTLGGTAAVFGASAHAHECRGRCDILFSESQPGLGICASAENCVRPLLVSLPDPSLNRPVPFLISPPPPAPHTCTRAHVHTSYHDPDTEHRQPLWPNGLVPIRGYAHRPTARPCNLVKW